MHIYTCTLHARLCSACTPLHLDSIVERSRIAQMTQADEKMTQIKNLHARLRGDVAARREAFQQVRAAMESTNVPPVLREALTNMGKTLLSSVQAEEEIEE